MSCKVERSQADDEGDRYAFFVLHAPCNRVGKSIPELSWSVGSTTEDSHSKSNYVMDSKAH